MKRSGNLIQLITDPENLRLAFWKAKKGKKDLNSIQFFADSLEENIDILRDQILNGQVKVGDYRYFKIFDPKERIICTGAFREHVLHHALLNICHQRFDRCQVFDSYASRPGKGVHKALRRSVDFSKRNGWFLKMDVLKFFDSIDHEILKSQLRRIFKDVRLLAIFDSIIDSYQVIPGRGVPIGNLTSQYFANHYLSGLDHFIKEQLQGKAYVRYMDDLVLWHDQKSWLKAARKAIEDYVYNRLDCQMKPSLINATVRGLPFLGFQIFPHHIRLSQRSKQRFVRKLHALDRHHHSGDWDEGECQRRAQALIAFTRHADSLDFRRSVLNRLNNCQ